MHAHNIRVKLTAVAMSPLNKTLKTHLFSEGQRIGTALTTLRL
ncbi:hypothetical protein [Streptosporangium sp. NPDC006930]